MNASSNVVIYVAGFATPSGVGGFEWSYDRAKVEQLVAMWGTEDHDFTRTSEASLEDLGLAAGATADEITDALDARPELWEPFHGERGGAQ